LGVASVLGEQKMELYHRRFNHISEKAIIEAYRLRKLDKPALELLPNYLLLIQKQSVTKQRFPWNQWKAQFDRQLIRYAIFVSPKRPKLDVIPIGQLLWDSQVH
jgi:hypothetical protein